MSKVFVTSDTHWGHKNIIRFCDRPFSDEVEMDRELQWRWNERVSNDDIVYFIGDFAFAPRNRIIEVLGKLNFKELIIVPGNHDEQIMKMWNHPVEPVWQSAGVENVRVADEIVNLRHDGKKFVLCHYPISDWDGKYKGSIHLHGHCHSVAVGMSPDGTARSDDAGKSFTQYPNGMWVRSNVAAIDNRFDIGVDVYGGPVELTGDLRYLLAPKGWK